MKTLALLAVWLPGKDGTLHLKHETAIRRIIGELEPEYKVTLITRERPNEDYAGSFGDIIWLFDEACPRPDERKKFCSRFQEQYTAWSRAAAIDTIKFDCLIALGIWPWSLASIFSRIRSHKKLICFYSNPEKYLMCSDIGFFEQICNAADGILLDSPERENIFRELFGGCKAEISVVRELICDDAGFLQRWDQNRDQDIRNPYRTGTCNLLTVGSLTPGKALENIPAAAAKLKEEMPGFCWFIIGDGPMRPRLLQQIILKDVCREVVLLKEAEHMEAYIRYADVYMKPEGIDDRMAEAAELAGIAVGSFGNGGVRIQRGTKTAPELKPRSSIKSIIDHYTGGV